MKIRPPTHNEAGQLARLYLWSAEHHAEIDPAFYRVPDSKNVVAHYAALISGGNTETSARFVAETNGQIAGMVEVTLADQSPSNSMLQPLLMASADIVVAPTHRRKGIGTALMQQAESWASDHGADGVILDMLRANEVALEQDGDGHNQEGPPVA